MMKAILLEKPGPPEALQYVDVPIPEPGPGQVLVRAHSIGVGMPEVLVRRGEYSWMPPLPAIPGIEMSGVVDKLGEGVTSLKVGQPVFVSAREMSARGGCYAEFIAAEANTLFLLPEGIDMEAAAALSNYQVAWHLLHGALRGMRYDSFMITAAAGGVGSAVIQLGKIAGKQVIGLVDTEKRAEFAQSLGADGTVNYQSEDVTQKIREITSDRGVDVIFDCFGGSGFTDQIERLASFGIIVCFGSLDGPPSNDVIDAMFKQMGNCFGIRFFSMHAFDGDRATRREVTERIINLLAQAKIKPPIWKRFPLADAGKAQAAIESGQVLGKVILKPESN